MKVSLKWVRELLPQLKAPAPAIERRLTSAGIEVEGAQREADAFEGIVAGEVREAKKHPAADNLKVTRVYDGEVEHVVICGAPNVAEGQKVALARVGTVLPGGMVIGKRAIRGVESAGMICSAAELGLSDDHDGIMLLKPRTKPGKPLADVLDLKDVVLELSVTPNRPDVLSHFGVARELAALFDLDAPKLSPRLREEKKGAEHEAKIEIKDERRCPRYVGRVIHGVKVGPSPAWVVQRLKAIGLRPISNVVDATNLVLMELGHPLHAFDLERLSGKKIVVRTAVSGESIKLLDGSDRVLNPDDLVIADAERPVALAGVMGGANSEVHEGSSSLLIESAYFDRGSVRRSAKRHGLHTEASHRFERGADPEMLELAVDRVCQLILELAGGEVMKGRLKAGKVSPERPRLPIRPERASLLIGRTVEKKEVRERLSALGLEPAKAPDKDKKKGQKYADALWWIAPSWRVDLLGEEDLIEEVARLSGYDSVPTAMPPGVREVWTKGPAPDLEREVRHLFAGLGFFETISLAFNSEADARALGGDVSGAVRLANPLGEETRLLRMSLLPALLRAARLNQDNLPSLTDLRLFEIGRAFRWPDDKAQLPHESLRVGLLLRGRRAPAGYNQAQDPLDAYDAKGSIQAFLARLGVGSVTWRRATVPHLHPRSASQLAGADGELGLFGELHPKVMEAFGLEGPPVYVAELDLGALAKARSGLASFQALPRFPPAQRDLSFFLDRGHEGARVLAIIRASSGAKALESVDVFDVYEGQGVPAGQKSMAVSLVFRAADRTLTDGEVEGAQNQIVSDLVSALGAELRRA